MFRGGGSRRRGNDHATSHGTNSGPTRLMNKGLFADGIWQCNCTPRLPAEHFKVKKEGANKGRWFYTCQNPPPKRCDFFLWEEGARAREGAAVLSGRRSEPLSVGGGGASGGASAGGGVPEGWKAGSAQQTSANGKRLFAGVGGGAGARAREEDDQSTLSPSPSPSPSTTRSAPPHMSAKRKAQDAGIFGEEEEDEDDEPFPWSLSGHEEQELAEIADTRAAETPHKAQKTGVYATPATTGKRKLPWLEQPVTPVTTSKPTADYFATPSRPRSSTVSRTAALTTNTSFDTPKPQQTLPSAAAAAPPPRTPSPPTRHKNALVNPADSGSTLTSEVLAALSSVTVPPDVMERLRSILTKHDLRTQGIWKGREISRVALRAKEERIVQLQRRMEALEAEREVLRGVRAGGREGV